MLIDGQNINLPDDVDVAIRLPASKSISNRLLIIQALAAKDFKIQNLSGSADSMLMQYLLRQIGANTNKQQPLVLDCRDAGTVIRFLTAFLSMHDGSFLLTGTKRMQ
jgi:3-phosphoshikimate 1-carboxyvinyltransferase